MVFSSVTFLFFFLPAFLLCYALLPFRNATILVFSLVFYLWGEGSLVLVLLFSVLVNYLAGRWIDSVEEPRRAQALAAGIAANLLLLVYFKYLGFLLSSVLHIERIDLDALPRLPLGISFFTFQAMSYLVDVYRRAGAARPFDLGPRALHHDVSPAHRRPDRALLDGRSARSARRTIHLNFVIHGLLYFRDWIGAEDPWLPTTSPASPTESSRCPRRRSRAASRGPAPWPTRSRSTSTSPDIRTWRSVSA